jgi:pilus assembly protein CpaB
MGRRTLLMLAALVVAALGTVLVYLYVQGLENEYAAGQEPVQVLVAGTTIAAGTTGAQAGESGAFVLEEIPSSLVVEGALGSPTAIADRVALGPIFPGEQIIESKFGERASSGLTFEEGSGQFAISVQLSDPARVAGFVQPGSEVVVFLTLAGPSGEEGDGGSSASTRVLLAQVPVVAVGNSTVVSQTVTDPSGQQRTEEIPTAILTLGVTQDEALQIVHAQSQGELYFGLLGDGEEEAAAAQAGTALTTQDLLD